MAIEKKKIVAEFSLVSVIIILVLLAGLIFFAVSSGTNATKIDKMAFEKGKLTEQMAQIAKENSCLLDTISTLKAKVYDADNFAHSRQGLLDKLKKEYAKIKPSPCDTAERVVNCDNLVAQYGSYVEVLNYNIKLRQNLIDTLQLSNDLFQQERDKCMELNLITNKQLAITRKSLTLHKIWAYSATTGLAIAVVVILL